jgi:hypothetical protein
MREFRGVGEAMRARVQRSTRWIVLLGACLASVAYVACADTNAAAPDPSNPGTENDPRPAQVGGYAPGVPGFEARRATSQAEIGEAMRKLDQSGDACGLACPALRQLRVGVQRRCAVQEMTEDHKICKEQRAQLLAIETRLKGSCGTCVASADAGAAVDAD